MLFFRFLFDEVFHFLWRIKEQSHQVGYVLMVVETQIAFRFINVMNQLLTELNLLFELDCLCSI